MFSLLLVDDEIHVVERLASTVPWNEVGIQKIYKAFSAAEALETIRASQVDIVITDIQMPGMTGLELAQQARMLEKRKTRFILLSGHADFDYAREAVSQGTEQYLLKPVAEAELLRTVRRVLDKLKSEWDEVISKQRMTALLNEHIPFIQEKLLNELLSGRRYDDQELRDKLDKLDIPDFIGKPFAILLVRMEGRMLEYDPYPLSLMEYAVGNILRELLGERFEVWHGKDTHDYLVFLVKPGRTLSIENNDQKNGLHDMLLRLTADFQEAVGNYLNGHVSVLVSRWGVFPKDLLTFYRSSISALRRRIGDSRGLVMTVEDELEKAEIRSLQTVYEYPSLNHLLETGQWSAFDEKLERIFNELKIKWSESHEHMAEVYFAIASAFAYITHKNGRKLSLFAESDYRYMTRSVPFASIQQLREWARRSAFMLKEDTEKETNSNRAAIIRQIKQIIQESSFADITLQTLSENLYLNPSYISKIFKYETGELLSDYIHRQRMDKAACLLANSRNKVYEIAASLGYQRTHSFIYAFKKHYGYTPQEYRSMQSD